MRVIKISLQTYPLPVSRQFLSRSQVPRDHHVSRVGVPQHALASRILANLTRYCVFYCNLIWVLSKVGVYLKAAE
jgi:hypothetical protein